MNTVEPIRDKKKIDAIKKYLLGAGKIRDYCLFVLGINTGLRVSDLLDLKWSDVLDEKKKFKDHIYIREGKTGKEKKFPINESAQDGLKRLLKDQYNLDMLVQFLPLEKEIWPPYHDLWRGVL
ncbi:MAG: site-specific recombinase XerD [Anaerosolibacter sp.]|jgi:integrase|uniref:tyrosine-type recombinase/integrase n=1 Tax=Anaerosolibacter sp. TaxID=1872527 RepID=UPI002622F6B7|nr:tyrosine-type recombinase/integrase [Anaerosolibacter sp.]MDF2547735.1 site-specific recombinase XerD [Anaerosolibacter sp.]